jgi:hypothetical protein
MNWHVYKKDDPSTWPEIDCPMLIYNEVWCEFHICKWNNIINRFFEPKEKLLHTWKECYYKYIGYIPNGYSVSHPVVCGRIDEEGNELIKCDFWHDGYCENEESVCEYSQVLNNYYIYDEKRIWKEFEK